MNKSFYHCAALFAALFLFSAALTASAAQITLETYDLNDYWAS
jgi:hypothetical protein